MDNIVFDRDYSEAHKKAIESRSSEPNVFDIAEKTGFWQAYKQMRDSIPKVIVPEDKAAYENLLPRLDALARRLGGKIHGEVSYEKWQSEITLILPFFEFGNDEAYRLLQDLAFNTHLLNITATEDGNVRIYIMINYFREIIEPSESTEKLIAGNELLAAHLEKYSQEERQKNESIANAFRLVLDYAQSVTGKPRKALFLEMAEFLTRYTGNLAEGLVAYCKSLGNPEDF